MHHLPYLISPTAWVSPFFVTPLDGLHKLAAPEKAPCSGGEAPEVAAAMEALEAAMNVDRSLMNLAAEASSSKAKQATLKEATLPGVAPTRCLAASVALVQIPCRQPEEAPLRVWEGQERLVVVAVLSGLARTLAFRVVTRLLAGPVVQTLGGQPDLIRLRGLAEAASQIC